MRKLLIAVLCFTVIGILGAQEGSAVTSSRTLDLQISSLPELKVIFYQTFKSPCFQGDNFLVRGNNLKVSIGGELTPISGNLLFKAVLTPIAFLELSTGGRVGSGWPLKLFGSDLYGIGINEADADGNKSYSGSFMDGCLYKGFFGATVQMDFGLLMSPSDWNHILFQSYHEINYAGYGRAIGDESWHYESDFGENVNGLNYYGNFVLGYQLPLMLNLIAFQAEMDLHLYDMPDRSNYGDDLIRWHFAAILGFKFTDWLDVKVVTQFRTLKNTLEEPDVLWNKKQTYYRNRNLDTADPLGLHFYRVAGLITFKLP